MLNRVWPLMLSLVVPWAPQSCTDDGGDGYAGSGGRGGVGAAGHGGLSSGGAAGSGAAGKNSGGAGAAGTGGSGTAGTGAAGTAGTAGTAGGTDTPQGSFTLSSTDVSLSGTCQFDPSPFSNITLTNTSSVPLTWHASGGAPVVLTPSGSTLAVGAAITISISATLPPGTGTFPYTAVSIDADVAPSQSIQVRGYLTGQFHVPLPPDQDFGEVALVLVPPISSPPPGSPNTRFIPATGAVISEVLQSSNPAFTTGGVATASYINGFGMGWLLSFSPQTAGPQETTLTFWSYTRTVCPPNTFKARGVGVTP